MVVSNQPIILVGAVRHADHMNQRRVRVLSCSGSRRGQYTARPHLPGLGDPRLTKKGEATNLASKKVGYG